MQTVFSRILLAVLLTWHFGAGAFGASGFMETPDESVHYQQGQPLSYPGAALLSLDTIKAEAPFLPDVSPDSFDQGSTRKVLIPVLTPLAQYAVYPHIEAMGWRTRMLRLQLYPFHCFR